MTATSRTSSRRTSKATRRRTSSRASADGRSRFNSRASLMTSRSGRGAARASRSASPESSAGSRTTETSGRGSKTSSLQDALHSSLVNRSRRRLGSAMTVSLGSIVWRVTWGRPATRLGLRYSRLDMWKQTTNESGYTSSPTPMASQQPRPYSLSDLVKEARTSLRSSVKAACSTCGVSGPTASGSSAATGKSGGESPAHNLWMMGYPKPWLYCGARATRLFRSWRRSSSKPSSRPKGK